MGEQHVSIIVPVGGDGAGFDRCLASLGRLEPQPEEIIVVIDGNPNNLGLAGFWPSTQRMRCISIYPVKCLHSCP